MISADFMMVFCDDFCWFSADWWSVSPSKWLEVSPTFRPSSPSWTQNWGPSASSGNRPMCKAWRHEIARCLQHFGLFMYTCIHTCNYITLHHINYITLHYITLHYINHITLHHITLHDITLHHMTLITLHYITLHFLTLHCITLYYITLHYIY